MATLAIGLIVYEIAIQWQSVTQGYMGISGIPPLGIGGYEIVPRSRQLVLLMRSSSVLSTLAARGCIRHSRFGRALAAIAGSEDAARALGIDVARYKLAAFLVSAAYAARRRLAVRACRGFRQPGSVRAEHGVLGFTMLYVGGIGTIGGPLLGAVIVSLLPEIVSRSQGLSGSVLRRGPDPAADLRAEGSCRAGGRSAIRLACAGGAKARMRRVPDLLRVEVTRRFDGLLAVDAIDLRGPGRAESPP